eukprot:TRINITY_DN7026_c0_g1_i2.p1 TRINITY_DN7026_c0_g1~~TRINITY_DN7026_c0_g1_i2.p1  ORF type:complete len:184 (+),score=30.77 TRINITY_DN7026_c0_g1_i2:199-750(+)
MAHPFSSNVFPEITASDLAELKRSFVDSAAQPVQENLSKAAKTSTRRQVASRKDCKYCGKQFASHAALLRHERVHSGERPFGCDLCGKRFTQKGNLRTHLRRHYKPNNKLSTLLPISAYPEATIIAAPPDKKPAPKKSCGLDMLLLAIEHRERPSKNFISPPSSDIGEGHDVSAPGSPQHIAA